MSEIKQVKQTKGAKGVPQQTEPVNPGKFQQWLNEIYNPQLFSDDELKLYYDSFKYVGFDRHNVLEQLFEIAQDQKMAVQIILACALRGPVQASKLKLSDGRSIESHGISASGMKGTNKISCQRITAATADLAAFYLKRLNFPKRIDVACPGYLQFPSAGGIKLPDDLRAQHREFSIKFSPMIKGTFNEQIYMQMVMNAYLDDRLALFS